MSTNGSGKKNIAFQIFLIVAFAIIIGFFGSVSFQIYRAFHKDEPKPVIQAPVVNELDNPITSDSDIPVPSVPSFSELKVSTDDYSSLVENVMPAVVSVECTTSYSYYGFWGQPQSYSSQSCGSGFFVSQSRDKLYIATNNHVVEDAETVSVALFDDTKVDAEIVGTDADYDLAVLSINISDITSETLQSIRIASIGNSDSLSVGAVAIAIGNALGYGQSTTVGYISAINRDVTVNGITKALVQTDAAINPGNSGGPLLNTYGQVIGINSVKYASEEIEGMGYAIPISEAVPIINELIDYVTLKEGEIGYLGIDGTDISQSYSTGFGMPMGVYVYSVEKGSPADESGIYAGDIITAINGRKVTSMDELRNRLSHIRAGETVIITVNTLSGGRYIEREVSVKLSRRP